MKYLLSWALIAFGLLVFFAGMRQYKWWLGWIGALFMGTGCWYFFARAMH